MFKSLAYAAALLLAAITPLFSQTEPTCSLSGNVFHKNGEPLTDAVVTLSLAQDNAIIKTEITDDKGAFFMTGLKKSSYIVTIQFNNSLLYTGEPFSLNGNMVLEPVKVTPQATELNEVVITKQKQFIERQQGKLVLNVEKSIASAGTSAFDVLSKAPGVSADSNDNITLRGRGGIAIHIDGRPSPLTGANLASYLKGIPAENIEKIELVYNPSAKYDAAGSSIINIITKKEKGMGTNGSITTSYARGVYGKNNNSLSINHCNKKLNVFGTYSNAFREGFNDLALIRSFYDEQGTFTGAYDQNNNIDLKTRNHTVRAGADYYASDKHTFGIAVNTSDNRNTPKNHNISKVLDAQQTYVSRFETKSNSTDNLDNYAINLNHRFAIDIIGSTLTTDLDYANYKNRATQKITVRNYDTGTTETGGPFVLFGDIIGNLDILAGKSDYKTTLPGNIGFEAGVKTSYVRADNNQVFYDRSNGENAPDPNRSNHFIYDENINAAYSSASGIFGKWNLQAGLRVENTNIKGRQVINNASFSNSYTQLFPNFSAGYDFNASNNFEISYSRRITRAGYDQLNPFKFYLDPTTYKAGYPYLSAQTSHFIDFTYSLQSKYFATLTLSRTSDYITQVIAPSDENPLITEQTFRNLATVDYYSLELIIPFEPALWWKSTTTIYTYYGSYTGRSGATNIRNEGNLTASINSVQALTFSDSFTGELTANYKFREIYAFMDVEPYWTIDAGLQKKFGNAALKLSATDIFYTGIIKAATGFNGYGERFKVRRDSRTVSLSFTYNFGSGKSGFKRRGTAADDLKQRAASGNA